LVADENGRDCAAELVRVPILGTYMRSAEHILVSRQSRKSQLESLKSAISTIKQARKIDAQNREAAEVVEWGGLQGWRGETPKRIEGRDTKSKFGEGDKTIGGRDIKKESFLPFCSS
jgi:hypothetical protein